MPPITPMLHKPPEPAPAPANDAALLVLIRLGQSWRAEGQGKDGKHVAFWRTCQAQAAARAVTGTQVP